MPDIGIPELLIILAIVIILFGPARIGGVGKSLGEAIRLFRQAIKDESERTPASDEQKPRPSAAPEEPELLAETTNARE
jgi:sec-independent protein translocase protein TatA